MKQTTRILIYIEEHGSITQMEATNELGVMRLGARVKDLRDAGYQIITTRESGRNRYGDRTNYARYTLKKDAC